MGRSSLPSFAAKLDKVDDTLRSRRHCRLYRVALKDLHLRCRRRHDEHSLGTAERIRQSLRRQQITEDRRRNRSDRLAFFTAADERPRLDASGGQFRNEPGAKVAGRADNKDGRRGHLNNRLGVFGSKMTHARGEDSGDLGPPAPTFRTELSSANDSLHLRPSEKFCMNATGRSMVKGIPDVSTANSILRKGFSSGARSTPNEDSSTTRSTPRAVAPSSRRRLRDGTGNQIHPTHALPRAFIRAFVGPIEPDRLYTCARSHRRPAGGAHGYSVAQQRRNQTPTDLSGRSGNEDSVTQGNLRAPNWRFIVWTTY
jgi:hypothetical protein